MTVRDTSIMAYEQDVKNTLGKRQKAVLGLLEGAERPLTNSEIASRLNWPINTITPRVKELREAGLVVEDCKRKCNVTGRLAYAWMIKKNTLF